MSKENPYGIGITYKNNKYYVRVSNCICKYKRIDILEI